MNEKEFYFIELQKKVNIGDVININGTNTPITQELIDLNPDKFKIVENEKSNTFSIDLNFVDNTAVLDYVNDWIKQHNIQKNKNSLFKTFDCVDIYDRNRTVYGVFIDDHNDLVELKVWKGPNTEKYHWFSTPEARKFWIDNAKSQTKFKDCEYVQYIHHSDTLLEDDEILVKGNCYSVQYLFNNFIVKEDDPIDNGNDFKFKIITVDDYYEWLSDNFLNLYKNITWDIITYNYNDKRLYIQNTNYSSNDKVEVYNANNDEWYTLYQNYEGEIFNEKDEVYYFNRKLIENYRRKLPYDYIDYVYEYPKNHGEDMFYTKSKEKAYDTYYNLKRNYYNNIVDPNGEKSPLETTYRMLQVIAVNLNGDWEPNDNTGIYVITIDNGKILIRSKNNASITDIPFKTEEYAQEAYNIVRPFIKYFENPYTNK